jgi:DNA polymerase III subunit epsilon
MKLAVLDTETSGLNVASDEVLEIAVSLYDTTAKGTLFSYATLLQPTAPDLQQGGYGHITKEALQSSVAREGDLSMVLKAFSEADALVAHNVNFDRPMVLRLFASRGITLPPKLWVCSLQQLAFPNDRVAPGTPKVCRRLSHLALEHGIASVGIHRAGGDVLLLCTLLSLIPNLDEQILTALRPRTLHKALVSFEEKHLAKTRGFEWNPSVRGWLKYLALEEIGELPFPVELISNTVFVGAPPPINS